MKDKITRLDIFYHLFKWSLIEYWNLFKQGIQIRKFLKCIKLSWKHAWIDSKLLLEIHKEKMKKKNFDERDIY